FNKLNNDNPSKKSKKKKKGAKLSLADMISKITVPENPKNNNDKKQRNDTTQILIDEKYYLGSIDIRLSDFAGCHEISNSVVNDIQTRYYMAPEMILDHPFNENCDVWSIGCM